MYTHKRKIYVFKHIHIYTHAEKEKHKNIHTYTCWKGIYATAQVQSTQTDICGQKFCQMLCSFIPDLETALLEKMAWEFNTYQPPIALCFFHGAVPHNRSRNYVRTEGNTHFASPEQ